MKCQSCGVDIPPEWVKAIQKNECPACEGEIMDSGSQELLQELSAAMEQMPNDPRGIAGWLLSNYTVTKIGEAVPVARFHGGKLAKSETVGVPLKVHSAFTNNNVTFMSKEGLIQDYANRGLEVHDNASLINEINGAEEEDYEDPGIAATQNYLMQRGAAPPKQNLTLQNYLADEQRAKLARQEAMLNGGGYNNPNVGGSYQGVRRAPT